MLLKKLQLVRPVWTRLLSTCPAERIPSGFIQAQPQADDLIIIAMSSGVDSSVAASIYSKKYKNCQGIFMTNWTQTESQRCLEQDIKDVEKVGEQLDIPIEMVNFEKDYWIDVFEPMIESYKNGKTPNPDIDCNKYVKFGKLVDHIKKKYDNKGRNWWLVTGHYSRILQNTQLNNESQLLKAFYKPKDQSYYLSQVDPAIFKKLLLPIGFYTKPEIREYAIKNKLVVAEKPDSQGLCFVGQSQNHFGNFLKNYIDESPGNFITKEGVVCGQHPGLWSVTIGQRARIPMPQGDPETCGVWFVSEKNLETNEITIVRGTDNSALFKKIIYLDEFKYIQSQKLDEFDVNELSINHRSLHKDPVYLNSIKINKDGKLVFELKDKSRGVAPGQYLAVYHRDVCLGSGEIKFAE